MWKVRSVSVMMHLGNSTCLREESSWHVGSKENSRIPAGEIQLEKKKKALWGNNALFIVPRAQQQIKTVFSDLSVLWGVREETVWSPEGDMCSWHICGTQRYFTFSIGRFQPRQVPTWSGMDSLIKAIWVCVLWDKAILCILAFPI